VLNQNQAWLRWKTNLHPKCRTVFEAFRDDLADLEQELVAMSFICKEVHRRLVSTLPEAAHG